MKTLSRLSAFCLVLAAMLFCSCGDDAVVEGLSSSPPVSMITSPSGTVCITPGQSVDFAGHGGNGTPPYTYLWEFGDAAIPDTTAQNPGPVTFPNTGTFEVKLHVTDSKGRPAVTSVTVKVKPDCSPVVASIDQPSGPTTVTEGQLVSFAGSATGGGPPFTYTWAFGDGDSAFTQNASHAYASEGTYTVELRATDSYLDIDSDTETITVTQSSGTGIAVPVDQPDGLGITAPYFAGVAGSNGWIMVYGQDGLAALDGTAGSVMRLFPDIEYNLSGVTLTPTIAPSPLTGSGTVQTPREALFSYSSTDATINYWNAAGNDFGMTGIAEFGGVTDAAPYGDDPASGGLVYMDYDAAGEWLVQSLNSGSGSFPGRTGDLMSSFARDATGSIVVVTNGAPGQLYLAPRPSGFATLIGEVGSTPRQIRCLDDLCVISCFDADSLWVATWDVADNVAIVGGVPVGDGPIGIDLLALGNGDIAVVSTGFNDDTYTIIVFGPTGALVSNNTQPVPAGCTAPPHAVWVPGTTRNVLFSCNATDNVFILPSGL
jgi:PKD repeat protein